MARRLYGIQTTAGHNTGCVLHTGFPSLYDGGSMLAGADGSPGFWVACAGPKDLDGPLSIGPSGTDEAVAVFSFEDEARLYLSLEGGGDGLRPIRVSSPQLLALLSGGWSGFRSVALDPLPGPNLGALPAVTSRRRFARFLASRA